MHRHVWRGVRLWRFVAQVVLGEAKALLRDIRSRLERRQERGMAVDEQGQGQWHVSGTNDGGTGQGVGSPAGVDTRQAGAGAGGGAAAATHTPLEGAGQSALLNSILSMPPPTARDAGNTSLMSSMQISNASSDADGSDGDGDGGGEWDGYMLGQSTPPPRRGGDGDDDI